MGSLYSRAQNLAEVEAGKDISTFVQQAQHSYEQFLSDLSTKKSDLEHAMLTLQSLKTDSQTAANEAKEKAEQIAKMLQDLPATGSTDNQTAEEVPTNQKLNPDLPDTTQKALDALWSRPIGGLPDGDIDLTNHKIENLAAGSSPLEAVNYQQLTDLTNRVKGIENISGSARRGPITISTQSPSGVPVQFEEWVQIGDVDSGAVVQSGNSN